MYIFTQKIQSVVIFKIKTVMESVIRILTLDNGMTMLLHANITIITVHARDYRYAFSFCWISIFKLIGEQCACAITSGKDLVGSILPRDWNVRTFSRMRV